MSCKSHSRVSDAAAILGGQGEESCGCCLGRRQFLGGLTALAAGALLPGRMLAGQLPISDQRRIDIHSHYAPPTWATIVSAKKSQGLFGGANPIRPFMDWTPAKLIEQMDQAHVATSFLSITTPGIWFGAKDSPVDQTRRLARECNEFGAKMRADYRGRFGQFAVLPLPDVEGSLHEVEYALDMLKVDGFGLLSHYGEVYGQMLLGEPAFAPVFEELNRRKAIVYVHRKISPEPYEIFGWDIHRTILSLLRRSGQGNNADNGGPRYPDIRFIFSHAGGTMPFLVERTSAPTDTSSAVGPNPQLNALSRFYYDTGHSNNTRTLTELKKIIPVSQIMFGTDYPYTNVSNEVRGLEECGVFNEDELRAIRYENAIRLLPKYKA